jgi:hypothetical protein
LGTKRSVSEAVLFATFVSPVAVATVAELTRFPVADAPTSATIVNTALPSRASVILVLISPVPVDAPMAPPVYAAVQVFWVMALAIVVVSNASTAVASPLFSTVSV